MLRALIVLPTRDLVNQVRETFETVAKGRGLKVCGASICNKVLESLTRPQIASTTGQHSFIHEQNSIVETGAPS
jgi:ATP-dependent RNA helicase DDX51/DBP6